MWWEAGGNGREGARRRTEERGGKKRAVMREKGREREQRAGGHASTHSFRAPVLERRGGVEKGDKKRESKIGEQAGRGRDVENAGVCLVRIHAFVCIHAYVYSVNVRRFVNVLHV